MNKTSKNNLLSACTLERHNCAWKMLSEIRPVNWRKVHFYSCTQGYCWKKMEAHLLKGYRYSLDYEKLD